ncbi:hypothetical protein BLOT_009248 [Blomia tropicalis]|nr:hypothetical protein BLOT_009248 [Blomia tropicalis]
MYINKSTSLIEPTLNNHVPLATFGQHVSVTVNMISLLNAPCGPNYLKSSKNVQYTESRVKGERNNTIGAQMHEKLKTKLETGGRHILFITSHTIRYRSMVDAKLYQDINDSNNVNSDGKTTMLKLSKKN